MREEQARRGARRGRGPRRRRGGPGRERALDTAIARRTADHHREAKIGTSTAPAAHGAAADDRELMRASAALSIRAARGCSRPGASTGTLCGRRRRSGPTRSRTGEKTTAKGDQSMPPTGARRRPSIRKKQQARGRTGPHARWNPYAPRMPGAPSFRLRRRGAGGSARLRQGIGAFVEGAV